ncbi:hypothetical protein EV648_106217 [Kribbella sp. VKM Ac-2568]|nr:hypothetical protein EV648_106217 [Kribbella sp. VKM Ac-2568]
MLSACAGPAARRHPRPCTHTSGLKVLGHTPGSVTGGASAQPHRLGDGTPQFPWARQYEFGSRAWLAELDAYRPRGLDSSGPRFGGVAGSPALDTGQRSVVAGSAAPEPVMVSVTWSLCEGSWPRRCRLAAARVICRCGCYWARAGWRTRSAAADVVAIELCGEPVAADPWPEGVFCSRVSCAGGGAMYWRTSLTSGWPGGRRRNGSRVGGGSVLRDWKRVARRHSWGWRLALTGRGPLAASHPVPSTGGPVLPPAARTTPDLCSRPRSPVLGLEGS